jgi:hypothetical protein
MSGTAPRGDQGGCDERSCQLAYGHKGEHVIRRCSRCLNRTRNAEERFCVQHESRATYEKYETLRADEYGGQP